MLLADTIGYLQTMHIHLSLNGEAGLNTFPQYPIGKTNVP